MIACEITRSQAGPAWNYLRDSADFRFDTFPRSVIRASLRGARILIEDAIARWDNARAALESMGAEPDDCDVEAMEILRHLRAAVREKTKP